MQATVETLQEQAATSYFRRSVPRMGELVLGLPFAAFLHPASNLADPWLFK